MKAVASRPINHAGKHYEKGAVFTLPDDQFLEWQAAGMVEVAPEPETKATPKGKA